MDNTKLTSCSFLKIFIYKFCSAAAQQGSIEYFGSSVFRYRPGSLLLFHQNLLALETFKLKFSFNVVYLS